MRILKPEGKATLQFLFSKDFPYVPAGGIVPVSIKLGHSACVKMYSMDQQHARWFDNITDSKFTNSGCDVVFGEKDVPMVKDYFNRYFKDVDMWFHDISVGRGGFGYPHILDESHPNCHKDNEYHGTHFAFIHMANRQVGV